MLKKDHSDPMSLNRDRKRKDNSFMSRAFVQNRLTDLCSTDHQYTMLSNIEFSTAVLEVCEDIVPDNEAAHKAPCML